MLRLPPVFCPAPRVPVPLGATLWIESGLVFLMLDVATNRNGSAKDKQRAEKSSSAGVSSPEDHEGRLEEN
jgi:hypothetical protein